VKNEKNLKLIATLNKGLGLCTGKYIARMDADDIAYPQRFEKQVAFMEAHPDYGLCGTDIAIDGREKSWLLIGDDDYVRFGFLFHNPFCHPTTFIRASIVREHRLEYPAEYIHAEEYIFWLHILSHAKGFNMSEKLLNYRLHEGQISTVFKKDQLQMGKRIRLELLHEIVLFSTEGMRRAHLVIAEMASQKLQVSPFDELTFNFGGWVTIRQLRTWLFVMKFSLLFRKKWDSIYLRKLIGKVNDGLRTKRAEEGSFLKRRIAPRSAGKP
jgi:glycosyltransferase involved in cell wall biosynthesis